MPHFSYRSLLAVFVAMVLITGCENLPGTKEEQSTVIGGAAGAVVGEKVGDGATGALLGALAGGVLGNVIGDRLEERDREKAAESLEENQPTAWTNDQTDTTYRLKPTETFERNGRTCREYVLNAKIDGDWKEVEGVACRKPDGTWQAV